MEQHSGSGHACGAGRFSLFSHVIDHIFLHFTPQFTVFCVCQDCLYYLEIRNHVLRPGNQSVSQLLKNKQ